VGTGTASAAERAEAGRSARHQVPRAAHAEWSPPADRPDPLALIAAQERNRLGWLVPVRHTRMASSPLAFFRGSAVVMAADLAGTPSMGVRVQLCGDAHLANFGLYASPERRWVFDVTDFDETLPGPWEWDVKRLAASFVLAARENGLTDARARAMAVRSVRAYRQAVAGFAHMSTLDLWYAQVPLDLVDQAMPFRRRMPRPSGRRGLYKLLDQDGTGGRFRADPPLLVPLRELGEVGVEAQQAVEANFEVYLASVTPDRRQLLGRFQLLDVAVKAVGVGSVGTRCYVLLLRGLDHAEPLFVQIKEAGPSALEPYLPASEYAHQGQRVVCGQRLLQAANDLFLGWSQLDSGPHYYWRQFHDTRVPADLATMSPRQLTRYADICGWTLARSHARSGDAIAIAGYLGSGPAFDDAVGDFALGYAGQAQADHARFVVAVRA
jgi:uncharacterized protein (DUF2252 family)